MSITAWVIIIMGLVDLTHQPLVHLGRATYYRPGLMERVARYRHLSLQGDMSYGTYPLCGYIGGTVVTSLWDPVRGVWGPWVSRRIVDCSQPWDLARHLREGLIEVPYQDAARAHFVRDGSTKVRFEIGP